MIRASVLEKLCGKEIKIRQQNRASPRKSGSQIFHQHDFVARFIEDEFVDHLLC